MNDENPDENCFCCGLKPTDPVPLNCPHHCCRKCLLEFSKNEKVCPLCQTPFPEEFLKNFNEEKEGKLENEQEETQDVTNQHQNFENGIQNFQQIDQKENNIEQSINENENQDTPGRIVVEAIDENTDNPQTIFQNQEINQQNTDNLTPSYDQNTSEPNPLQNENQTQNTPPPVQPEDDFDPDEDTNIWLCPICMEEIHNPVVTECGHVYCKRCIEEWLQRQNVCPTCNRHGLHLRSIKNLGPIEDRPEPDNTLKANTIPKRFVRFVRRNVLTKTFFATFLCYTLFVLSFFIQ